MDVARPGTMPVMMMFGYRHGDHNLNSGRGSTTATVSGAVSLSLPRSEWIESNALAQHLETQVRV